jgi:replication factor C subunit 1
MDLEAVGTKMDFPTLKKSIVSVCGISNADAVKSFLSNNSIRVVPWCSRVGCLVAGPRAHGRWKHAEALSRGIPILSESDLLALKPTSVLAPETELWVDKYKPKELKDIVGNAEAISTLQTWLTNWSVDMSTPHGALVSGPPGIGKTTTVHLICAAVGYKVVEFNASDTRSASSIRAIFEDAARSGCVGYRRCIIMDEVDGMSSGDRGGIGELARLIRGCAFPVICIANERGTPRLRPLVSACVEVRFSRPVKTTIAKALMARVCAPEEVKLKAADLEMLCERNGNDIRAILNFLQFSYGRARTAGAKDELQRVDAFTAAGRLFGYHGDAAAGPKYNALDTRMNYVFLDHGMVPLMIGEAYPAAADRGRGSAMEKLAACARAAENMSNWDLLDARIMRSQAWGLLPAAAVAITSAASSAAGPAPFQIFPALLGKMSKRGKIRRAQADMRHRARIHSDYELMDMRPLLRTRLFGASDASTICDTLESMRLTRDDMFETLSETVFKGDEKSVTIDTKLKTAISREMNKRAVKSIKVGKEIETTIEEADEYDSEDDIDYDIIA